MKASRSRFRDAGLALLAVSVFLAWRPVLAIGLLHTFEPDGQDPRALCSDGTYLYGTTSGGGTRGKGIVFRVLPDGTDYKVLHEFGYASAQGLSPSSGLVPDGAGSLYGTTIEGGSGGYGVLFRISVDGTTFAVVHAFQGAPLDGRAPVGPLVLDGGFLYGTTFTGGASGLGTAYTVKTDGASYSIVRSFGAEASDGIGPTGLTSDGAGNLFGTTGVGGAFNLGTIFKLRTDGSGYALVHAFEGGTSDGSIPQGPPVPDGTGLLLGTTMDGGPADMGTIYSVKPDATGFAVLHAFAGPDGDSPAPQLTVASGVVYGVTRGGGAGSGTAFRLATNGGGFRTLHSFSGSGIGGDVPSDGVLLDPSTGRLHGTTDGSAFAPGTIYTLRTDGSIFQTLHVFRNDEGARPLSGLVEDGSGLLYGTTISGGIHGRGTVFRVRRDGTDYAVLHSFAGGTEDGDGSEAVSSLLLDGANLYGTTRSGGAANLGTLFRVGVDGSGFTVLHSFSGGASDGSYPEAEPIADGSGNLFGTTIAGGADGQGTVYRLTSTGTVFEVIHSFAGGASDGVQPRVALARDEIGDLWGTTNGGGAADRGIIFSVAPEGSFFVVRRSFSTLTGFGSSSPLVPDGAGSFIGTTSSGGAGLVGTLFTVSPTSFTVLHEFGLGVSNGQNPIGSLAVASGTIYGTTWAGGAPNVGTVYQIKLDGSAFALIHAFSGIADGARPNGGVLLDGTMLLGTTIYGGARDLGTVFRLSPFSCAATAAVSGSATICNGGSTLIEASLTGTGPWDLTWSDGVVQTVSSSPAVRSVAPPLPTSYTVSLVTDSLCTGSSSGSAIVTLHPIPAAPVPSSNSPVCTAGTLNLFAPSVLGGSYWWTGPNGFTSATQNPTLAGVSVSESGTYSVTVTVDGCESPPGSTAVTVFTDAAAPVVTPPASAIVDQSVCCGTFGGVKPLASPPLDAFLAAGSAVDDCDAAPARLAPQVAGVDVDNGTCFEAGTTAVTFRFRDVSMHVGTAAANAIVRMFGDLNLDLAVDPSDMVVLRAYFNFAIAPETPPFTAPLGMADLTHDGTVDPSDFVILRSYFNFAVSCLAP